MFVEQELREMLAVTGSEAAEGSLLPNEALTAQQVYLTECINQMVSLKSIYPQTRHLTLITRNSQE